MRGHRYLRTTNQLALIDDIKHDLSICPAPEIPSNLNGLLFGPNVADPDLSTRQYMMVRLGYLSLTKALLRHLSGRAGKMAYPMPKEWCSVLESHGIKVARGRSRLLWLGYGLTLWGYGSLTFTRYLMMSAIKPSRYLALAPADLTYFDQLSLGNLPTADNSVPSYDILSWYAKWAGRPSSCKGLAHMVPDTLERFASSLPVLPVRNAIDPTVPGWRKRDFALWAAQTSLRTLWALVLGRVGPALMLFEAGKRATTYCTPKEQIFGTYMFHNSGWIYRPLWSFEAEAKGAEILFYFYSTNCEDFKETGGYVRQSNQWNLTSWPTCLVWTDRQAAFIKSHNPQAKTICTGPIWFSGHGDFDAPNRPSLALFDVQPVRDSFYSSLGAKFDVYRPDYSEAFFDTITTICKELHVTAVLKRKRDIGSHLHPRYQSLIQQISHDSAFREAPPNVAAQTVIGASDLVISMPYTSTALIARDMGKPSCFYDPLSILQPDDRAAHGIPIVQGREALHKWVEKHLE